MVSGKQYICLNDGTWGQSDEDDEEKTGLVASVNKAFGWPPDSKNGLYVLLGGIGFIALLLFMPRGGPPK